MAGGHLEAVFDDGGVHASFKLGCDTLIARQPYHYDIAACVDIRGSNTFDLIGTHTISIDLGADRHISGPGVAGIATAHRYLCSFDIAFGPTSRPDPVETSWQACEQSCLPKPDAGLAVAFVDGVLAQRTDDDGAIAEIRPGALRLVTASAIPPQEDRLRQRDLRLGRYPGRGGPRPGGRHS